MPELSKIGDKFDEKPSVFELIVEDHVPFVNPADYGLDIEGIDPTDFFITSGDAVEKSKILEKELWQHAGDLRKRSYQLIAEENDCSTVQAQSLFRKGVRSAQTGFAQYEAAVWKAAGSSRKLRNALEAAKGEDCFLETEWDDHKLLCIPKNPRR
jgi:hypothetical protein